MLFIVGQVGRHYFEHRKIPIDINFRYTAQNPTMNRARHIAKTLVELFVSEKLDGSMNFSSDINQFEKDKAAYNDAYNAAH